MALIETILTLHRRRWSQRRIARELNIHRETVARYLREASGRPKPAKAPIGSELADGNSKPAKAPIGSEAVAKEAPTEATMGAEADSAVGRSLCEPWRDIILDKLQAGLTAQRIYQDLVSDHGDDCLTDAGVQRFECLELFANRLPFKGCFELINFLPQLV